MKLAPPSEVYRLDGTYEGKRTDGKSGIWVVDGHLRNPDDPDRIMPIQEFKEITSTLYAEMKPAGPWDWQEPAAMFDVIKNCWKEPKRKNDPKTFIDVMKKIADAYYSRVRKSWKFNPTDSSSKDAVAITGVIMACIHKDVPYSNGAYFWDGADTDNEHFREWGVKFTDSRHKLYNLNDKLYPGKQNRNNPNKTINDIHQPNKTISAYDHELDSTAAYGGTIFWKYCRNSYQIMGRWREWP